MLLLEDGSPSLGEVSLSGGGTVHLDGTATLVSLCSLPCYEEVTTNRWVHHRGRFDEKPVGVRQGKTQQAVWCHHRATRGLEAESKLLHCRILQA